MSNQGKIEIIPNDATIDITVGGGAYAAFTQLMYDVAAQKSPEEFAALLERLKKGEKPADKYEFTVQLYISILYEIETQASKQGKTKFISPEEIKL